MDTLQTIRTRRAVRSWADRDVPEELLSQVLEAGHFAPSPLNSQAWHFTVIRKRDTLKKLAPEAHHGSFVSGANLVIVVTVSQQAKVDTWLFEHEQHIFSGACAIENMWLAAHDLGLGACWVTLDEKATRVLLGIPETERILGSLAIGYPKEPPKPHAPTDRKKLETVVFYEKFGHQPHGHEGL